jgi:hypothetical protein
MGVVSGDDERVVRGGHEKVSSREPLRISQTRTYSRDQESLDVEVVSITEEQQRRQM